MTELFRNPASREATSEAATGVPWNMTHNPALCQECRDLLAPRDPVTGLPVEAAG